MRNLLRKGIMSVAKSICWQYAREMTLIVNKFYANMLLESEISFSRLTLYLPGYFYTLFVPQGGGLICSPPI